MRYHGDFDSYSNTFNNTCLYRHSTDLCGERCTGITANLNEWYHRYLESGNGQQYRHRYVYLYT